MSDFSEKLAKLAVHYAVDVEKGDQVIVQGYDVSSDLVRQIFLEVIKAGGNPHIELDLSGARELFFKNASKEQLEYMDPLEKLVVEKFDKFIHVYSDNNTRKLQAVDPEKMGIFAKVPERRKNREIFEDRFAKGELRWILIPDACEAFAQEAGMDVYTYKEFIEKALMLDKDDPSEEWRKVEKNQQKIVDYLDKVENIHVIGEDTDLTLTVKGRKWINCCGHENLPDGEVFTGPIENSINGHIRFTYPGIYQGREIENIYLEFKDGKVIKATASKGEDLLKTILGIEGADGIGEFAVGTNYNIKDFTKNMLFDEKIGGTMHMALGMGFKETGSSAMSAIHWDILKDMTSEDSKIIADDKVIYQAGKWQI